MLAQLASRVLLAAPARPSVPLSLASASSRPLGARSFISPSTASVQGDAPPPDPIRHDRRPFRPLFRAPSLGHFTTLHAQYGAALQPLLDLAKQGKGADAEASKRAELNFGTYHSTLAHSLRLNFSADKETNWRSAIVQGVEGELGQLCGADKDKHARVRETTRRLVEGGKPGFPSAFNLLRGVSGRGALRTVEHGTSKTFDELLRLVQLVLTMQKVEEEHQHRLLDPSARNLLASLDEYFTLLAAFDRSSASSPSAARAPTLVVLPSGETLEATPEQDAVIHSPPSPGVSLVVAAAGTGKTTGMLGYAQARAKEGKTARCIWRQRAGADDELQTERF
ncbi:hypothetical protein JCM10207_001714 [Rhodosporidiobolus poonsookiae]